MPTYTNSNGVSFVYTPPSLTPGSLQILGNGVDAGTYVISALGSNSVQNTNGTTLIASVLGNSNYFDVPGVTQTYDLLAGVGSTLDFHIGGNATVNIGVGGLSGITIDADGGGAFYTNTASLLTAVTVNLSDHGAFTVGDNLLALLNGSRINFGTNGGFFVVNGAGSGLIDLTSLSIVGFDTHNADYIDDQEIAFSNVARYSITTVGGSQLINFLNSAGTLLGSLEINGTNLHVGNWSVSDPNGGLTLSADGLGDLLLTPNPCFLAGALIRTTTGEVPVEDLRVGDTVVAYVDGNPVERDVTWVGSRRATVRQGLPDDQAQYPVCIRADAIAAGVPHQDLLVTSEHCLFIDGKLIPARMLVNGVSIYYQRSITSYDFYHVETAPHSILAANGMLTESYLDTGNRRYFAQPGAVVRLPGPPRSWETDAAAPLTTDRETVEPIWQRLAQRVGDQGEALPPQSTLITDADLHLVTDTGIEIRPTLQNGQTYSFAIPSSTRSARLVSRASRPFDTVGPYVDDRRKLGVLVGKLTIGDGYREQELSFLADSADLNGWYAAEAGSVSRWTNGNAFLPLDLSAWGRHPIFLDIDVLNAGPYLESTNQTATARAA
jgi:hypothetical protein